MNKKFKAKWIKALRSGKFKQGRDMLRTFDVEPQYCCLGVARHCLNPKAIFKADSYYLNRKELKAIGLSHKDQKQLALYNDDEFWSFKKIANYIEKNL